MEVINENPKAIWETYPDAINPGLLLAEAYFLIKKDCSSLEQLQIKKSLQEIVNRIRYNPQRPTLSPAVLLIHFKKEPLLKNVDKKQAQQMIDFFQKKMTQNYQGYTFPCDEMIAYVVLQVKRLSKNFTEAMDFFGKWSPIDSYFLEAFMLYNGYRIVAMSKGILFYDNNHNTSTIVSPNKYTNKSGFFTKHEPVTKFRSMLTERSWLLEGKLSLERNDNKKVEEEPTISSPQQITKSLKATLPEEPAKDKNETRYQNLHKFLSSATKKSSLELRDKYMQEIISIEQKSKETMSKLSYLSELLQENLPLFEYEGITERDFKKLSEAYSVLCKPEHDIDQLAFDYIEVLVDVDKLFFDINQKRISFSSGHLAQESNKEELSILDFLSQSLVIVFEEIVFERTAWTLLSTNENRGKFFEKVQVFNFDALEKAKVVDHFSIMGGNNSNPNFSMSVALKACADYADLMDKIDKLSDLMGKGLALLVLEAHSVEQLAEITDIYKELIQPEFLYIRKIGTELFEKARIIQKTLNVLQAPSIKEVGAEQYQALSATFRRHEETSEITASKLREFAIARVYFFSIATSLGCNPFRQKNDAAKVNPSLDMFIEEQLANRSNSNNYPRWHAFPPKGEPSNRNVSEEEVSDFSMK